MLRNPCNNAADPLVETKLTEYIFFRRICQRLTVCIPDAVNSNGVSEGRICLIPRFLGVPVVIIVQSVNDRIKGRINASAVQNILCFGVVFVADRISVCSCRGDQEVQRLSTGITGALIRKYSG